MLAAGIDIGSITTEALLFDNENGIRKYAILQTGADSRKTADAALDTVLLGQDLAVSDLKGIVATGCGRKRALFTQQTVTEITCIAKGVHYLFPDARIIIDIGGQDTKAIKIDNRGRVTEFEMNDKCAAGTGRFIEVMAKALDVELSKIGELSLEHKKELTISSICTVFAESEVVSLVSEGEELQDILYGIHKAIAGRTMGLISRLGGIEGDVVMTGGVAKNVGVVRALESTLQKKINIYSEPQVVGALGAAILALEKAAQ